MRHVALVVAVFETLSEADEAVRALLQAGYSVETVSALGRAGGGRLLLAGRVGVQPVGQPAKVVDRGERLTSAALAGAVASIITAVVVGTALRWTGGDPVTTARPYLSESLAVLTSGALCALAGAALGALTQLSAGLPHRLALRIARYLERGDVAIAVRATDDQQTRSVEETLALHGAHEVHVARGKLEAVGGETTPLPGGDEPLLDR